MNVDVFVDTVETTSFFVENSIIFANALIVDCANNEWIFSITTVTRSVNIIWLFGQIVVFNVTDTAGQIFIAV